MDENKLGLNWSAVEKALTEGTFSGYKIGILETEKLFKELLQSKHIPGGVPERKIKYVQRFLSLPDKLDYSRNVYERIVHEPHFEISREETKHIISGYWQAMLDIEEGIQSLSLWETISLKTRYTFSFFLKNLRNIFLVILTLAALIWFLGETAWGKKVAGWLVLGNHFFIFKILLWAAFTLLSLLAIGGILYLITSRKKRI